MDSVARIRCAQCGPRSLPTDLRMALLLRKAREHVERRVDVSQRMVGADLKADLLIALGHHRIVEARGQNAVSAQMRHQGGSPRRIAQDERHDRMLSGKRLE